MFTVTVGRDASGKSSTRAPLASRYSVTPSIEATLVVLPRRGEFVGRSSGDNGQSAHENPAEHKQNRRAWRELPEAMVVLAVVGDYSWCARWVLGCGGKRMVERRGCTRAYSLAARQGCGCDIKMPH